MMSAAVAKLASVAFATPVATGVIIPLTVIAELVSAAADPGTYSIPAPVITPIIGYGTIFTGIVAVIGMVAMFLGMKYALQSAKEDLVEVKGDIKEIKAVNTQVSLHTQKLSEVERRLGNVEDRLYLNDTAVSFGRTGATRSGAFRKDKNDD